jgi:hypothetical protein
MPTPASCSRVRLARDCTEPGAPRETPGPAGDRRMRRYRESLAGARGSDGRPLTAVGPSRAGRPLHTGWEPEPGGGVLARLDVEEALGAEERDARDAGGAGGGENLAGGARAGGEEVGEPVASFGEDGE